MCNPARCSEPSPSEDDMKRALESCITAGALWLIAAPACQAQSEPVSVTNPESAAKAVPYWTPERFQSAKPLPLPLATPGATSRSEPESSSEKSESSPAAPPAPGL